jgi:hypothetical protein
VKAPAAVKRLLQPASTNQKLGAGKLIIVRGRWRTMPLYQLVLEERKTCPSTCEQWSNCYGNNMPFANRVDAFDPSFFSSLSSELQSLSSRHSAGFVVRLHVLGDFYSVPYANFWLDSLKTVPELRVFGYTHRKKASAIGRVISKMNRRGAWIRWSDAGGDMSANVRAPGQALTELQCPQEIGKTESCLTCGLCWQTTKSIKFLNH